MRRMDVVHSPNGDFLWEGTRIQMAGRPVCLFVQGLSLIAAERKVGSGRDKHQQMRQSAGTTMAFVTWRHVPRGTCHVPPREPLAKQYWLDQIFERNMAETWNFQGRCTPVGYTCHVSHDPVGSNLCPQGTFPFFSLLASGSVTLRAGVTNLAQGGTLTRAIQSSKKIWPLKFRGVKILIFRKKFISIISGRIRPK